MKSFNNFLYGTLAIIATALLGTACVDSVSEEYDISEGIVKLIPFTVNAQSEDATKVTIDGDGDYLFEPGDYLVITSEDGTVNGELKEITSGSGTKKATFKGTLEYTGSGDAPASTLKLTARLVSTGDAIGSNEFVGGLATGKTSIVRKYSTFVGTSTYGAKNFALKQGTAFIKFNITLVPAPDDDDYEAALYNNDAKVATADVYVEDGEVTFYGALPTGALNHAKVTLCGRDFKFSGTLLANKLYNVTRTYNDDLSTPLTLEALVDGTITINIPEELTPFNGIYYSINDETPVPTRESDPVIYKTTEIHVHTGDKVTLFGDNTCYSLADDVEPDDLTSVTITCSNPCYIYGNVMSLIQSTGFASLTELTAPCALAGLFNGYLPDHETKGGDGNGGYTPNHLMSHPSRKLVLPATQLSEGCYASMFVYCTDLTTAPELPATVLTECCYYGMFAGCFSLTSAPDIYSSTWPEACCDMMFAACTTLVDAPALTAPASAVLGAYCFEDMFNGCTSLKNVPGLPFLHLGDGCYKDMFYGCTSLVSAPELPAEDLADRCYSGMFEECTSLTTAPVLPATDLHHLESVYEEMFEDCTSLTTAPALPATDLTGAAYCYQDMFSGCTSLTTAPALPATELSGASQCYSRMFFNCTNLTQAPALSATHVPSYGYSYMFQGCTSLEQAPDLPATSLSESCYHGMFMECTNLTAAPATLPATTLANSCYASMFNGCTSLTTAPILPATTLAGGCYGMMFYNCSSLNYIKCLATSFPEWSATYDWVYNVASEGTFIAAPGAAWEVDSPNGIPVGWSTGLDRSTPLTLEVFNTRKSEGNQIIIENPGGLAISYTLNGGSMQTFYGDQTITVAKGDVVQFYGDNAAYGRVDASGEIHPYTTIFTTAQCYIYGNIMSLVDPDGFATAEILTGEAVFASLFHSNNPLFDEYALSNHPKRNIVLPATTLSNYCYAHMFLDNRYVDRMPELPATTMKKSCYEKMFSGSKLHAAPALPATTLAEGCYRGMFKECYGLQTAPELPATTLVKDCYANMFYECSGLKDVTCLATDISAEGCTEEWLAGVAHSGVFHAADGVAWTPDSESGVPVGWLYATPGTTVYSISYNQNDVELSDSPSFITAGSSLQITVNPKNPYTGLSVSITMGEDDVTDQYWYPSDRIISIPSVTGDLTIQAWGTDPLTQYWIDKNLTHCSLSNDASYATEGQPYETQIVVDKDYVIETVQVSMDYYDVTDDYYDAENRTISIPDVTGNISITAVARPVNVHNVTLNLAYGIECSNTATTWVQPGYSYTNYIYPGKGFDDMPIVVTVTMGGTDITGQAVNDKGNNQWDVYIDKVTGDVVVTAVFNTNVHSVTYDFEHANHSNYLGHVADGAAYSTSVGPDFPYQNVTVTVTMGGTDITTTAWDSGKNEVNIASVTDDVVITARGTDPAATFHVTANLTNCSMSNGLVEGYLYAAYQTTLSCNKSYMFSSVTVVMDGTDVTSSYYNESSHVISISSVTGDLEITAVAVPDPSSICTITYDFENNIESKESTSEVAKNDSYYTTVYGIKDDEGREIELTLTMGGTDVTSKYAKTSDGTSWSISIKKVTGNLVITARFK